MGQKQEPEKWGQNLLVLAAILEGYFSFLRITFGNTYISCSYTFLFSYDKNLFLKKQWYFWKALDCLSLKKDI